MADFDFSELLPSVATPFQAGLRPHYDQAAAIAELTAFAERELVPYWGSAYVNASHTALAK
jgi:hypothetical protein